MMKHRLFLITLLLLVCLPLMVACGDDDDDDDNDDATPIDDDDDTIVDDDDNDDVTPDDDDNDDTTPDDDDTTPGDDDTSPPPPTTPGFSYIPSGTFTLGSPTDELGRRDNETQHEVTLTRHFEMRKTEVTQREFEELMGYNPSYYTYGGTAAQRPVEQVSWYDALAYANKLSEWGDYAPCYTLTDIECADEESGDDQTYCAEHGGIATATVALNGADSVYECEGFRLPTEAEWEYAARAGTTTAFYNGPITNTSCEPLDENLRKIAWYCGNAYRHNHPTGEKAPNDWDLYDMLGNAKEWTWDFYARDNTGETTDPVGPADGNFHVVRGGAARFHGAAFTRSAFRSGHRPDHRVFTLGFRPVRTLPDDVPALRPSPVATPPVATQIERREPSWPDELPFEFTRPQVGDPLTPQEITEFTQKITSFWVDTQYFNRYRWLSHGMGPGYEWPEFKLFFQVNSGVKDGDVIEIRHTGNSDNLMIRTGKIFNAYAALYLASGDDLSAYMVDQYGKGLGALVDGFVWSEDDPELYIMPRTIFAQNNTQIEEGREVYVNYDPNKEYDFDWNGWTIPFPTNPAYGDIWVRTMRSKDDVPHFYRMVPLLYRLRDEAPDQDVRDAAEYALHYMESWVRDIVDAGYFIRTKDMEGDTFIPMSADFPFMVNDLASFTIYDPVAPNAECNAELVSAFIAYQDPLANDCGDGRSFLYDFIASYQHYFNDRNIIRYFHIDAVMMALMHEYDDMAYELLEGLTDRSNYIFDNSRQEEHRGYDADTASYLLAAASAGLPLTNREAQHIVDEYSLAVDHYLDWPNWDLWAPSVPEGPVDLRPSDVMSEEKAVVRSTEMAYFIEYCYSPFRNEAGADVVDCDVILDPTQWGAPLE